MSWECLVALVGDYDESVPAHRAIPLALALAAAYHRASIRGVWVSTADIEEAELQLRGYQGVWCVPASPYKHMQGALAAIRFARERKVPFLGTCGGFQHALLEYAQGVLGMADVSHAEVDPSGKNLLIAPLTCALVEKREEIVIEPDSILSSSYGALRIEEGYRCSYGPNPAYDDVLFGDDFRVTARGVDGGVRAAELRGHPFFVGTLFQPERCALQGELPPLVREFSRAVLANGQGRGSVVGSHPFAMRL